MLHRDQRGQGMVEYGLMAGLLLIIVLAVFVALGPELNRMFEDSANSKAISDGQVELDSVSDTT